MFGNEQSGDQSPLGPVRFAGVRVREKFQTGARVGFPWKLGTKHGVIRFVDPVDSQTSHDIPVRRSRSHETGFDTIFQVVDFFL